MDRNDFIERAVKVHGDRYDYSLVSETPGWHDKVSIICPEHGAFTQDATSHIRGTGCPKCGHANGSRKHRHDTGWFIEKAREVHGDRYDYSQSVYTGLHDSILIGCREHGTFSQSVSNHLKGCGCPECANAGRAGRKTKDTGWFIEKANEVHNGRYDYSETVYHGMKEPVTIICPQHGKFTQTPDSHIRGRGCPECGRDRIVSSIKIGFDEFVRRAKEVHGDKYEYDPESFTLMRSKMRIKCPQHGWFEQTACDHIDGCGCRKCTHTVSNTENTILGLVKELCPDAVHGDRTTIGPKELDIFVPSRNVAIEYNGILWHSEHYETTPLIEKTELCEAKGIRLIHIFEDEWLERPEVVKSKLRHLLGCDDTVRVHGRKLSVRSVEKEAGDKFLNRFHIQGSGQATVRLGAYYNDELVAVMYFKRTDNNGRWELTRFATHDAYNVVGGAGKLFKAFVRQYDPVEVKSFADRRWSNCIKENVYTKLGFTLAEVLKPDYRYVVGNRRVHKFNFRKRLLLARYPDVLTPGMTERQMTDKLGIYRIYDCGLLRYEWKKPDQ